MQDDSLLDALRIPITVIEDEPSVNISDRNVPRSPVHDPMSPSVSDFEMLRSLVGSEMCIRDRG